MSELPPPVLLSSSEWAPTSTTSWAPASPQTPLAPLGEVVTIAHTKGGAGKTSLTFNLAYALSTCGARVLVVDLDQQTGQSVFLGASGRPRIGTNADVADVGAV
ncbi:MAG: AAA family ATPase, partial [Ilumatobacteraceae bacterium]